MEFLSQAGVDFEERNISENRGYIQELRELGSRGTPTTVIGDEVVIGFNRAKLSELLDL